MTATSESCESNSTGVDLVELNGKRALVTGATGGIGGAIARALDACGARVAISARREDALQKLAAEMGSATASVVCDLNDSEAAARLISRAADSLDGTIDILVNNAGVTKDKLALRMSESDWRVPLDVNLTAAFILARSALRSMIKARWGRIISITSVVGVLGNPGQANYVASKAGLIGMSKALAMEVASRGVTVNCIAPGFIETPMTAALGAEQRRKIAANIPMARFGSVDDIASGVAFLSSEEARYITGHTLHINGGMAMV